VRHRRHTLRATALLPCVAVLLVTPLTSAESDPGAPSGETRDPISDARTTSSTVTDPLPQEPVVADESGVLPVRILMSGAGTTVSVPGSGLTEKSPSSQGTSGSRSPGDDATSGAARERGTPTTTGEEQSTPHAPHSPHRWPADSVRPGHSSARPDGQHDGSSHSASPDRPSSVGGDRNTGRDRGERRDTHHAGNAPGAVPDTVPGTEDLYEPEPPERDPRMESHRSAKEAATGEVSPVLPLGAGLTSIGLGLALLALRLRRG
jgi:hypothetical protein